MSDKAVDIMLELTELKKQLLNSVAEIDKQIKVLELSKSQISIPLTDEMEKREQELKHLILTRAKSLKIPGMTAVYQIRHQWDNEGLLSMADEIPAIMQWHRAVAHVALRYRFDLLPRLKSRDS